MHYMTLMLLSMVYVYVLTYGWSAACFLIVQEVVIPGITVTLLQECLALNISTSIEQLSKILYVLKL